MITVNIIGERIVGKVKDRSYSIQFDPDVYSMLDYLATEAAQATSLEDLEKSCASFNSILNDTSKVASTTDCPYIKKIKGQYFFYMNDMFSPIPMPMSFVNRIFTHIDKKIDYMPLIKFWMRLLNNPNLSEERVKLICKYIEQTIVDQSLYNTFIEEGYDEKLATHYATVYQTPITTEGLISTYKVSRIIDDLEDKPLSREEAIKQYPFVFKHPRGDKGYYLSKDTELYQMSLQAQKAAWEKQIDEMTLPKYAEDYVFQPAMQGTSGDAFYCGDELGHIIKVGKRHKLEDWSQVDCDDYHSCVPGLHVGNLDYIKHYQWAGTITHTVFVCPSQIGAVVAEKKGEEPTLSKDGALRVKEYYVYGSKVGINKNLYTASSYGEMLIEEYVKLMKKTVYGNIQSIIPN